MDSPFADIIVSEITPVVNRESGLQNALLDPELVREQSEKETDDVYKNSETENSEPENGFESETQIEHFWFSFPTLDQNVKGYEDPANAGFPLYTVTDRTKKLSKNFTVGEFAQSAEGKYKWSYYRVDNFLINQLQDLRDVLEKPIVIIDGYYPPAYFKNVLKKIPPPANPHFSGQGVKIRVDGMAGKELASWIIQYCAQNLSISVGEWSVAIYSKKGLPRITSYIKNENTRLSVIRELDVLDKKVKDDVIYGIVEEDIPKPLVSFSTPSYDPRLIGQIISDTNKNINEVLAIVDKFLIGKSSTDQVASYLKTAKNFTKLSDDIAKLQGGKTLSDLLKNDQSGLDFLSKIRLLKSSFGILESITKLSSVSEKKKKYEEFLKSHSGATIYYSIDLAEGLIKLSADTISLGFGIACILTSDAATKLKLLNLAEQFEKKVKAITVIIEGVKIIRSVVNIIIAISEGNYSAIKDNLVDIGKSVAAIVTAIYLGTGITSLITGIYLYYKFIFVILPGMVAEMRRSIAIGGTVDAMRELDHRFRQVTESYLYANLYYEKVTSLIGYDEEKWYKQKGLQSKLWSYFSTFFRKLYDFEKFVYSFDGGNPTNSVLFSSFPSIPKRIFADKFKFDTIQFTLKEFPKSPSGFVYIYAEALNDLYRYLYEGIIKCHLEINDIYKERYAAWGTSGETVETGESNMQAEVFESSPFEQVEAMAVSENFLPTLANTPFLSAAENRKATLANESNIKKSGIAAVEIFKAIEKSVDIVQIRKQIPASSPSLSDAIDAAFTEAVHQFQIANYLNPKEHDGILGVSTLETLGFFRHGLKQKLNSSGFYGQSQLNRNDINPQIPILTGNEFSAENWFEYIIKPAWLGVKITDGIHVLLYRKLKEAEAWLASQPQYQGLTPAAIGKAVGFNASTRYSGARLSSGQQAMHGFGLAIDINVQGNPWIGAGWIKYDKVLLQERFRMIDVLRKASGKSLPGQTIFAYLDHLAQTEGNDSRRAYQTLKQLNDEFISYLRANATELSYWTRSQTFGGRSPLNGFLNLHLDLVYALRQIAGLAWGAMDFGPKASGDIMHFDLRTTGVGKFLCQKIGGFIPTEAHPIINKEMFEVMEVGAENEEEEVIQFELHESIGEGAEGRDEHESSFLFEEPPAVPGESADDFSTEIADGVSVEDREAENFSGESNNQESAASTGTTG